MKKKLSIITLAALVAGIIFGLFLKDTALALEPVGSFYLTVLRYLIVPVIFTSVTVSTAESRKLDSKFLLKAVGLFIVMFVISFILSSVIVLLIDPARDFRMAAGDDQAVTAPISIGSILLNLLPQDLKGFLTGRYLFFVIAVSWLSGWLITRFHLEKPLEVLKKVRDVLFKFLEYLMYVMPVAVFVLGAVSAARYGTETLLSGLRYIITAYICGLAVLVLVMILPLKVLTGRKLRPLIEKIMPIWLITLSTCSSAATLPYTIKLCREDLKTDPQITDITVPLGCTIHMCGGAVSFSLLGLFCARLYGVPVTFSLYLYMILAATALNMSAPGIPNGGVVIGASYLEMMGLPLGFIGFYSGIYKVLDMLYTSLNVTGDISAVVLLDHYSRKTEK